MFQKIIQTILLFCTLAPALPAQPVFTARPVKRSLEKVRPGKAAKLTIRFRNTGDKPLWVIENRTSTSGTKADLPSEPLQPGQKSKIKLTHDTSGESGKQSIAAYLVTNEPAPGDSNTLFRRHNFYLEYQVGKEIQNSGPAISWASTTINWGKFTDQSFLQGQIKLKNTSDRAIKLAFKKEERNWGPILIVKLPPDSVQPGDSAAISLTLIPKQLSCNLFVDSIEVWAVGERNSSQKIALKLEKICQHNLKPPVRWEKRRVGAGGLVMESEQPLFLKFRFQNMGKVPLSVEEVKVEGEEKDWYPWSSDEPVAPGEFGIISLFITGQKAGLLQRLMRVKFFGYSVSFPLNITASILPPKPENNLFDSLYRTARLPLITPTTVDLGTIPAGESRTATFGLQPQCLLSIPLAIETPYHIAAISDLPKEIEVGIDLGAPPFFRNELPFQSNYISMQDCDPVEGSELRISLRNAAGISGEFIDTVLVTNKLNPKEKTSIYIKYNCLPYPGDHHEIVHRSTGIPNYETEWKDGRMNSHRRFGFDGSPFWEIQLDSSGAYETREFSEGATTIRYIDGDNSTLKELRNGKLTLQRITQGTVLIDTSWHFSGLPAHTGSYRGGQRHGLFHTFHGNGRVSSENVYVQGNPQGTFRKWHPNGQLAEEGEYRENKIGLWKFWDWDGNLIRQEVWEKGILVPPGKGKGQ